MKTYNILVFPCGSEIGLEVFRSLQYSSHINLIGASSINDHGRFIYKNYIGNVPFIDSESVIPFMADLVNEYSIDAIYPTMDTVIEKFKRCEQELNCKIISSEYQTTLLCLYKTKTYEILKNKVKIPHVYKTFKSINEFPVFVKPVIGYGSRGVFKAENRRELIGFLEHKKDLEYILCEYLPGKEYTVDCFTDRNRVLKYSRARLRSRISNGISVNTSFVDDDTRFNKLALIINENISFRGAWFFQVKEDKNNELTLLEMASRLGGSSGINRCLGVNLALLSVFDIFEIDVEILRNDYRIELDRALSNRYMINLSYDNVYVDFDDCLIIKGKLNLSLISFLYKAVNEGHKIILLTKHRENIYDSLKKYRLCDLFDEVICIEQSDDKYKYITSPNSLFIDDSYIEREAIKKRLNLHVFGPDMVECLID